MFCHDKHTFVARKVSFSHKHTFVRTKAVFCRVKHVSVTTKLFLATQMILVAAPANDREEGERGEGSKIGARDMGKKEGGEEDRRKRDGGGGGGGGERNRGKREAGEKEWRQRGKRGEEESGERGGGEEGRGKRSRGGRDRGKRMGRVRDGDGGENGRGRAGGRGGRERRGERDGAGGEREGKERKGEGGRESMMVTVDDIDSLFFSVDRNSTGPVTVKLVTAAEEFWQWVNAGCGWVHSSQQPLMVFSISSCFFVMYLIVFLLSCEGR